MIHRKLRKKRKSINFVRKSIINKSLQKSTNSSNGSGNENDNNDKAAIVTVHRKTIFISSHFKVMVQSQTNFVSFLFLLFVFLTCVRSFSFFLFSFFLPFGTEISLIFFLSCLHKAYHSFFLSLFPNCIVYIRRLDFFNWSSIL